MEITSAGQLQEIINAEITKVISDDKLKSTFEKIDKAIGNNSELRAFKAVLEKDNTIIPLLMDYKMSRNRYGMDLFTDCAMMLLP